MDPLEKLLEAKPVEKLFGNFRDIRLVGFWSTRVNSNITAEQSVLRGSAEGR